MLHSALPPAEEIDLVPLADIARGGMGMVQLCRAKSGRLTGRALAVKRLNPAIEQEPEFVNMFLDETWITATINSPHVVKVEAWGRDDVGLYLAVELVQGVSLSRLVKESKEKQEPFAERTVANIASQICAGLQAAHELRGENGAPLGLVHRDLTPGNVLVGFDGLVKIADFGIAKAEERLTSTRIGMMKGKPAYMAPEQARGGGIDGRADLFALGVVIFELLSGRRPWLGNNDLETLVAVSTTEPPKLLDLRKVSPVFAEIVERCLKKNPEQRLASAQVVREMLDGWRRERGFDVDDQASLAAFVQRNTGQQQAWFQQALHGELSRGGVTFMDLEAKIDQGRKKSVAAPEPAHAAVSSPSAPSSGQLEEIDDAAQTRFMAQRTTGPAQPPVASPGVRPKLAATMALSPEENAALSARLAAPQSPRPQDLPLPPRSQPHFHTGQPPSGPVSPITAQPTSSQAMLGQPPSGPVSPRVSPIDLTAYGPPVAVEVAGQRSRGGSAARWVAMVLLMLGLAVGAYYLVRTQIVPRTTPSPSSNQ